MTERGLRIGEAAARAEVSTRTLRYYEELGLIEPSGHSPGGARRYSEADVERLLRVRELQRVMGFDLEQIRYIIGSEMRLAQLKEEFQHDRTPVARQREITREAVELNDTLRREVREKLAHTQGFLEDLNAKAVKYRRFLSTLGRDASSAPAGRGGGSARRA
jgi:DNA-binding transcriptional MerR regulator